MFMGLEPELLKMMSKLWWVSDLQMHLSALWVLKFESNYSPIFGYYLFSNSAFILWWKLAHLSRLGLNQFRSTFHLHLRITQPHTLPRTSCPYQIHIFLRNIVNLLLERPNCVEDLLLAQALVSAYYLNHRCHNLLCFNYWVSVKRRILMVFVGSLQ